MKKTTICLTVLATLSSSLALASDFKAPKIYGDIQGQFRFEDNKDYTSEIRLASVGLKGIHETDLVNILYNLEGEYSNSDDPNNDDLTVSEAKLILINKTFGGMYFGTGTVGTYVDLYSKVDIFDSNNMHPSSASTLFRQGYKGTNQVAYTSPSYKGLSFKVAVISPDDENGADIDILGLRIIYRNDNFSFIVNRAEMDEKFVPTGYVRTAVATSYKFDNLYVGALLEHNADDPLGDSNVYAVSTSYQLDQLTFKLGYQAKQYADDVIKEDEALYLANVSYAIDKHFSVYAEVAEAAKDTLNDNINLGLNFKF